MCTNRERDRETDKGQFTAVLSLPSSIALACLTSARINNCACVRARARARARVCVWPSARMTYKSARVTINTDPKVTNFDSHEVNANTDKTQNLSVETSDQSHAAQLTGAYTDLIT